MLLGNLCRSGGWIRKQAALLVLVLHKLFDIAKCHTKTKKAT